MVVKPLQCAWRVLTAILAITISQPVLAAPELFAGRASVIDGDTIEIHGQRIRLEGYDAPESAQLCYAGEIPVRCGQQAGLYLDDLLEGKTVVCYSTSRDKYDRLLATCSFDDLDIGAIMVESGNAMAYRRYSSRYIPQEKFARANGIGIWSMSFTAPWDWRRAN
jgi:endonuclease YncB( thermonuclease family)